MNKEEYNKYFGPAGDPGSKVALMQTAIANAKLRAGKVSGYKKLRRKQLYRIVQKDLPPTPPHSS